MATLRYAIAVLGAGSFGTAIATHLAKYQPTVLWCRGGETAAAMQSQRCNQRYLPQAHFPEQLTVTADLCDAVTQAEDLVIAVPSHAFEGLLQQMLPYPWQRVTWLTKGLNPLSQEMLHQTVLRVRPQAVFAVLSGPSFAQEIGAGLPAALTLASPFHQYRQHIHGRFHHGIFRVYHSDDHVGVQLAGAMKNVIAIAAGVSDGLGLGASSRAALITRGLYEIRQLGTQLGASADTFYGLSGIGDLMLTATDNQSRNRRFGLALGQDQSVEHALSSIGQVVEGKDNAVHATVLGTQHGVPLPICDAVRDIIAGTLSPHQAVTNLLTRPATHEC